MDEIIELTDNDYSHMKEPDQFVLVEVGDILDQLCQEIRAYGEVPLIDPERDALGMDAFMMDIFQQVGYLPEGHLGSAVLANDVLQTCGQYFDILNLTPLQHQLWLNAIQELINRFAAFKFYGPLVEGKGQVHAYDYYTLRAGAMVLTVPQ